MQQDSINTHTPPATATVAETAGNSERPAKIAADESAAPKAQEKTENATVEVPAAPLADEALEAEFDVTADSLNALRLDSAFYLYPFDPVSVRETVSVPEPPAWEDGLLPVERPMQNGTHPGFIFGIVLLMLALCLSFKTIQRIWGTLIKRLWTTRVREDYDHITIPERRTVALLLCVTVFFIGLIGSAGLTLVDPGGVRFNIDTTLTVAAFVAAYFVFQYAAYWVIGYTFTTPEGRILWIEGFTASMSLLGLTLLLPGIAVLFYPVLTGFAVILSVILYFVARIMFICKGFRIFYTNLGSIVYFILYLCTLEIIPVAFLYYSVLFSCAD